MGSLQVTGRRGLRCLLMASASATAMVAAQPPALAGGPALGVWGGPAPTATAAATAAAQAASQAAAATAKQTQQSLAQAAAALQAMQAQQNAARQTYMLNLGSNPAAAARATLQLPQVPDGLKPGGLVANTGAAWIGANLPTSPAGSPNIVNVQQTQQNAVASWSSFNVGANTTLNFVQQSPTWSILNRVIGGDANPSQILGHINAPGTVLVINQNGIIFGAGSQINIHSLVASSLDVGSPGMTTDQRNQFFLNDGIGTNLPATTNGPVQSTFSYASATGAHGDVTVEPGAQITTSLVTPDAPGFVYLFGPNVANYGTITSPAGEVAMVAASHDITLRALNYDPGQNGSPSALGSLATNIGVGIRGVGFQIDIQSGAIYPTGTGQVTNPGLIETPRGTTILNGDQITMSGVISADTSITRNSQVFLDAVTSVDMSGTISIQPFENGETLPLSNVPGVSNNSVAAFVPGSVEISAYRVTLEPQALISAPGANVTLTAVGLVQNDNVGNASRQANFLKTPNLSLLGGPSAPEQVVMEPGATIDVSGLQNVQLPASYNIFAFQPQNGEFNDQPLQQNGILVGKTLYIDIRNTGTRSDGSAWIGTPVGNAGGQVSVGVALSIDQLLTMGGSVSLKTDLSTNGVGAFPANGQVILKPGSTINVAGGSEQFRPGMVPVTLLIGSDGKIYTMSQADPNITYTGIVGDYTVAHAHWNSSTTNVSETFVAPLGGTQAFQPGYVQGANAGTISVQSFITPVLQGTMKFGAPIGPLQSGGGTPPFQGGLSVTTPNSIVVADGAFAASQNFTSVNPASALLLSATQLSGYGLSSLGLTANDLYIPANNSVTLAPGGSFSATMYGAIDIAGSVVAHSGQISLTTDGNSKNNNLTFAGYAPSITHSRQSDIYVGGTLDVSGLWTNDFGATSANLIGPRFINGGAISITTQDGDDPRGGLTGNIILAKGSLLDTSSGGYINQFGVIKTQSFDVPAGNGGSITLMTFQGTAFAPPGGGTGGQPDVPQPSHDATVQLGGTLRGYGFATGGTLTIETPAIQIGGTPSKDPNVLNLPVSFFSTGGFSSYVLESPVNVRSAVSATTGQPLFQSSITLAAGTNLVLQQQNFSNTALYQQVPTGANIGQVAQVTTLPSGLRQPVNLTLAADNILLDTNSTIIADPSATINLNGISNTSAMLMLGSITDHGGSLNVQMPYVWLGSQAHLDFSGTFVPNAVFGFAGGATQNGRLLPGGTVTFNTSMADNSNPNINTQGFVIAENGSSIDVSGAAATIVGRNGPANEPQAGVLTSVPSWSDGGTVSVNTGTFLFDGTFKADAGAPQGNRGTLWLGGSTVALQQNNTTGITLAGFDVADIVPFIQKQFNVTTTSALANSVASPIHTVAPFDVASADQLEAFDTVYLYGGVYNGAGGSGFFSAAPPQPSGTSVAQTPAARAPLQIYGDVNLTLRNRLFIEGNEIQAMTPNSNPVLSAPYVMFAGAPGIVPAGGSSTLTVNNAQTIDIQSAAFAGFSQVTLNSQGDIRLLSPPVNDGQNLGSNQQPQPQTVFFGNVVTNGNITFEAQRVYPATAVDFEIVSTSPTGVVDFEPQPNAGPPSVPLSAGARLTVAAASIIQNGNLFAPQGQIVLGGVTAADLSPNDPLRNVPGYFVAANSVKLGAGSTTSVSLDGTTVPYGETEDGINWFYNSNLVPLTAPPQKSLRLNGQSVTVAPGAKMDLSGGGDLQAIEFVAGKGGSKEVLSNIVTNTGPSGSTVSLTSQAVYAIFPGNQPKVGAFDIDFNSNLGDRQPLAGQQIYLNGGNGIAAGWYTLYPAHYATLPGAMRVVDYGNTLTKPGQAGLTLPDGTRIVGGYYGQSNIGTRSSGTELFAVQTGAVWRRYSEIDSTSANAFFIANAANTNTTVPQLPIDAGALGITALSGLELAGSVSTAPANLTDAGGNVTRAGLGGQLDITSTQLDVVDPGAQAPAGYVAVDAGQINRLGFASILIGGTRIQESNGTLITPVAVNVRLDDVATPLVAPEIIVVAAPLLQQTTVPTSVPGVPAITVPAPVPAPFNGSITVARGVTVQATGPGDFAGRNYLLGSARSLVTALGGTVDPATGDINGVPASATSLAILANYASFTGGGALLMASNNAGVTVTRQNVMSGPITINFVNGSGAAAGTVVLPSIPGYIEVDANARIAASSKIGTVTTGTVVLSATGGADVAQAGIRTGINIDPSATVTAPAAVTIEASNLDVGSTGGWSGAKGVISPQVLSQMATTDNLTLRALAGNINIFSFPGAAGCASGAGACPQNLTLDGASLIGQGSDVTIASVASLTLTNSSPATPTTSVSNPAAPGIGTSTLTVSSVEIDLNGGNMNVLGFGSVNLNTLPPPSNSTAGSRVVVRGGGSLTFAATAAGTPVDLKVNTPNLLVEAGSTGGGAGSPFVVTTSGRFSLTGTGTAPPPTGQFGGNLQINAASITLQDATIQAQSGAVTLHATAGDVALNGHSLISAPGYADVFFDETKYTPGGRVALISDTGSVTTAATSTIDISQVNGAAGELDVTAPAGNARLFGAINGAGQGGIFRLNTLGGFDSSGANSLNSLAAILTKGGVTGEIDIHTGTGSIILGAGGALTAQTIALTADDPTGGITIASGATLNASGAAGGAISLYGYSVDIEGSLIARASDPTQTGGKVTIGIAATPDSNSYNTTYGYENVSKAGFLTFGAQSVVDLMVTGATSGATGTVDLRVPLLSSGGVNLSVVSLATFVGVKNLTAEAYATWSTTDTTTGAKHFDGFIDPAGNFSGTGSAVTAPNRDHTGFYGTTLANFVQTGLNGVGLPASAILPGGINFQLQPGISLENPSTTINGGNISVLSSWNLAAGTMNNLQNGTFNPSTSSISFIYRYGFNPGDLTLRAVSNVNINASISDGFFDYQNLSDPNFIKANQNLAAGSPLPMAPAPTDPSANTISPGTSTPLQSYDLFPATLNVANKLTGQTSAVAMDSWSFHITAGANLASANPNAVGALTKYGDNATAPNALPGQGNVIVSGHTTYAATAYSVAPSSNPSAPTIQSIITDTISLPTLVRTGTGSITINAARDLELTDPQAPGVIYTAGRNTAPPSGSTDPNVVSLQSAASQASSWVAGGPFVRVMGPPTAAAFPTGAGDIIIDVQQDIIGIQNVFGSQSQGGAALNVPFYQFYSPWLLAQTSGTSLGAGAFQSAITFDKPQTAWWIEFGSFDQGVLSAGGNVTVTAGRDIRDFSVSLPTTGRFGGLTANGTQVAMVVNDSGNLVVRAGGNLYSGSFYEGSGTATITVGGSVKSDWSASGTPVSTALAVDTGQLSLTSGGSMTITGILNPTETLDLLTVPDRLQNRVVTNSPTMDTYGPQSAVRLTSISGNVMINSATRLYSSNEYNSAGVLQPVVSTLPATFEITAFGGNIMTPATGFVLTDSPTATLNLLASGTIDLRGGVAPTSAATSAITYGGIAAGTALINLAFNPYEPNISSNAVSTPVLAHANDPANDLYDRIYALRGDILGGPVVQIPRPVLLEAGHDIVDLNLTAQNIRPSDVSEVIAGHDLYYTGLAPFGGLQIAGPGFFDVEAGHNLGPFLPAAQDIRTTFDQNGFLVQQGVASQQGIVSSGNDAVFTVDTTVTTPSGRPQTVLGLLPFPVGNSVGASSVSAATSGAGSIVNVAGYPIGIPNQQFIGPPDVNGHPTGAQNPLLPSTGASIVAMFGVSKGVNYAGVVSGYVNQPVYLSALRSFMKQYGVSLGDLGLTMANGQVTLASSGTIPPLLKMFVDQIYFDEIKTVSDSASPNFKNYLVGYQMVNTLFPASFGYTQNSLDGVTNGNVGPLVHTGDLDMLHATIQTDRGGNVQLFGPGGNIIVGSLATEANTNFHLNNLGILTLDNGAIDTFTDVSVLVNSSRVFTEQGGDVVMWSSNGNLDAGRGSRTVATLSPLQINIDNNDYETIDLGGLVTGSGIGVLKTSQFASTSNVFLMTPNGQIDLGTAGIRSSGNIVLLAPVIVGNQGLIQAGGTVTLSQTVSVPSIGTLTTASTTAPVQSTGVAGTVAGPQPSVIIVEVVGYGGGGAAPTDESDEERRRNQARPPQ
jgi:filamentous hemagglutinin family protein